MVPVLPSQPYIVTCTLSSSEHAVPSGPLSYPVDVFSIVSFEDGSSSQSCETLCQVWHMAMISPLFLLCGPCGRTLLTRACVCAIAGIIDAHPFLFTVVLWL